MLRGGDTVLHVDDPPIAVEPLAVRAAVAGRPAVVDVDDTEPARRPELDAGAVVGRGRPRRTAVAEHSQWGQLAFWRLHLGVGGRVVERVALPARACELDLFGSGDPLDAEAVGRRPIGRQFAAPNVELVQAV